MRDLDALIAFLDSRMTEPFAWGSEANDCFSFPAAAVEAMTGDNPLRRAGHHWTTQRGALRVLKQAGGIVAAVDSVLPRLPGPAFAHRGDVGLASVGGSEHLVVVEGHLIVAPGLDGLVRHPRDLLTHAWSAEWTA